MIYGDDYSTNMEMHAFLHADQPLKTRAILTGCCGRAEGPEWRFNRWWCPHEGPRRCCLNQIETFVKEFESWLQRGAPFGSKEDHTYEYRDSETADATTRAAGPADGSVAEPAPEHACQ